MKLTIHFKEMSRSSVHLALYPVPPIRFHAMVLRRRDKFCSLFMNAMWLAPVAFVSSILNPNVDDQDGDRCIYSISRMNTVCTALFKPDSKRVALGIKPEPLQTEGGVVNWSNFT